MKRALRTGAAVLVFAGGVWGCGGDGDGGVEPAAGRIEAAVTLDDAPAEGVVLRLFGSGGGALGSESTGSDGVAVFGGLDGGGYEVEVEPPVGASLATGEDARKSTTVTSGGTSRVTFDLLASVDGDVVEVVLTSSLTFSPADVRIDAGTTVVWRNGAAMFHTITPDGHGEWQRATVTDADQTFQHTFETPGTYAYYCEPHESQGMTGVITVQ